MEGMGLSLELITYGRGHISSNLENKVSPGCTNPRVHPFPPPKHINPNHTTSSPNTSQLTPQGGFELLFH